MTQLPLPGVEQVRPEDLIRQVPVAQGTFNMPGQLPLPGAEMAVARGQRLDPMTGAFLAMGAIDAAAMSAMGFRFAKDFVNRKRYKKIMDSVFENVQANSSIEDAARAVVAGSNGKIPYDNAVQAVKEEWRTRSAQGMDVPDWGAFDEVGSGRAPTPEERAAADADLPRDQRAVRYGREAGGGPMRSDDRVPRVGSSGNVAGVGEVRTYVRDQIRKGVRDPEELRRRTLRYAQELDIPQKSMQPLAQDDILDILDDEIQEAGITYSRSDRRVNRARARMTSAEGVPPEISYRNSVFEEYGPRGQMSAKPLPMATEGMERPPKVSRRSAARVAREQAAEAAQGTLSDVGKVRGQLPLPDPQFGGAALGQGAPRSDFPLAQYRAIQTQQPPLYDVIDDLPGAQPSRRVNARLLEAADLGVTAADVGATAGAAGAAKGAAKGASAGAAAGAGATGVTGGAKGAGLLGKLGGVAKAHPLATAAAAVAIPLVLKQLLYDKPKDTENQMRQMDLVAQQQQLQGQVPDFNTLYLQALRSDDAYRQLGLSAMSPSAMSAMMAPQMQQQALQQAAQQAQQQRVMQAAQQLAPGEYYI